MSAAPDGRDAARGSSQVPDGPARTRRDLPRGTTPRDGRRVSPAPRASGATRGASAAHCDGRKRRK